MSLTQEDYKLLQALKKDIEFLYSQLPVNDGFEYVKPSCLDFTPPKIEEQSYVRCIKSNPIYEASMGDVFKVDEDNWIKVSPTQRVFFNQSMGFFERISEQEYTAQQEPKELINDSKGEKYKVNTRANHSKFEVIVYSIESEEKADKIATAIQQLLKTL